MSGTDAGLPPQVRRGPCYALRRGEFALLSSAGPEVIYEMAVRCFLELGRPALLVDGGCMTDPYAVARIARRVGAESAGTMGARGGSALTAGEGPRKDGGEGELGGEAEGPRSEGGDEEGGARREGGDGEEGPGPGLREGTGLLVRRRRTEVEEVLRNIHVARAFTAHQLEALIVERLGLIADRVRPAFVGVLGFEPLFTDDGLDRTEARVMRARCLRALRRLARERSLLAAAAGDAPRAPWHGLFTR